MDAPAEPPAPDAATTPSSAAAAHPEPEPGEPPPEPSPAPLHLHVDRVEPDDGSPERWLAVLHGIYGNGRNWGSVVRRAVRARPGWGALLVDLRGHGDSSAGQEPHTVEAAARDVLHTAREEGAELGAVLGHSFGGKVALECVRLAAEEDVAGPEQVWFVDSTPAPGEPEGAPWRMLSVLREHPGPFSTREAGVEALESEGFDTPVARWMATNLVEELDGWRWRLDPDQMESLLRDFFDRDLRPVLESPPDGTEIHVLRASRSKVLADDVAEGIERAARETGRVHLHEVEGGHWLNADNPDAVAALLEEHLP